MFEGPIGKKMMIDQGYVPVDCLLPVEDAGPIIFGHVQKGEDVCGGCNLDRSVCGGRPNAETRKEQVPPAL